MLIAEEGIVFNRFQYVCQLISKEDGYDRRRCLVCSKTMIVSGACNGYAEKISIIFNGNGYTDEWVEEAEKRGLYNLKTTPDALPHFIAEKNIALFTKHGIFTKEELFSR